MASKRLGVFMVFAESQPDALRLHDPNTPPEEKDRIRRRLNHYVDVVRSEAERGRSIKQRRWGISELRDRVMADYVPGKYGQAKLLRQKAAKLSGRPGFPLRTVQGWIEDARKAPKAAPDAIKATWKAVAEGQLLSRQRREAAQKRKLKR